MPKLNEIRHGKEIGHKDDTHLYMWFACAQCGNKRWVITSKGIPRFNRCQHCVVTLRGDANPNWRGGKSIDKDKYILIKLKSDDFFYPMAISSGYVREHRLVMAKHLNRCLLPWEVVHHKNGITTDNYLGNLELLSSNGRHNTQINKYILKLENDNSVLRARIKELENG